MTAIHPEATRTAVLALLAGADALPERLDYHESDERGRAAWGRAIDQLDALGWLNADNITYREPGVWPNVTDKPFEVIDVAGLHFTGPLGFTPASDSLKQIEQWKAEDNAGHSVAAVEVFVREPDGHERTLLQVRVEDLATDEPVERLGHRHLWAVPTDVA